MNTAEKIYEIIMSVLKSKNVSVAKMLNDCELGKDTVCQMKRGQMTSKKKLKRIADYLNVTMEYLLVEIQTPPKALTQIKNELWAMPQRIASLNISGGKNIGENEDYKPIERYTGYPHMFFKIDTLEIDNFMFDEDKPIIRDIKESVLIKILHILDCCAETKPYQILQLQLSRIVMKNLLKVNIKADDLKTRCKLYYKKIDYIYNGEKNIDLTVNFGFNFSDIMHIVDKFKDKVNVKFLFTGREEDLAII